MFIKDISILLPWLPYKVCDFGKEHHEEHFCVIILNVGHWFRRCGSKIFLFLALVVIKFSGVEPFVQLLVVQRKSLHKLDPDESQ